MKQRQSPGAQHQPHTSTRKRFMTRTPLPGALNFKGNWEKKRQPYNRPERVCNLRAPSHLLGIWFSSHSSWWQRFYRSGHAVGAAVAQWVCLDAIQGSFMKQFGWGGTCKGSSSTFLLSHSGLAELAGVRGDFFSSLESAIAGLCIAGEVVAKVGPTI